MKIGKLTSEDLKELIFSNIKDNTSSIISSAEIGNDCAAIEVGEKVVYLSTDPITGTTMEIGKLAVNINCNDIATEGIYPLALMLTILAPPNTKKEEISQIMKDVQEEAGKIGVTIIGGHTEITAAVNKIIISATAIGVGEKKARKDKRNVTSSDRIIITKGVGIEGTGIIAFEKEEELLNKFGSDLVEDAKKLLTLTSVVKEGVLSSKFAKGMHDVTEGGLLGAIWESSSYYNLGVNIDYSKIYISDVTKKICEYCKIDPLKLISSGTMLIVTSEENSKNLIAELKSNGIEAFDIGFFTENKDRILLKDNKKEVIEPPESDELYKVL